MEIDELGALKDCLIPNIQLGKVIGHGAYGNIMEAKWEGSVVAVKEIHSIFKEVDEEQFQALKVKFVNECKRSSQFRHPNIVRFLGVYLPPGTRVPSLVMERLQCSLTELLGKNPTIPLELKLSTLHQIVLGLRYLHSRTPPIIHRDLSSNNILISKGMEAKIADLGTVRFLDPNTRTPMSLAPGTKDFMPPEALNAASNQLLRYKQDIDIFSFGCVMLHVFSHEWPTPSENVLIDATSRTLTARSEVERRAKYLGKVPKQIEDVAVPLIVSCLENFSDDRPNAEEVCDQLETLIVNSKHTSTLPEDMLQNYLLLNKLQNEVTEKTAEIENLQKKLSELELQSRVLNTTTSQVRNV